MKLLITYIPFQVLLGVLLGIVFPVQNIYVISSLLLIILVLMFFLHRYMMNRLISHSFFFLLVLLLGMSLSWFSQMNRNDLSKENHYTNFIDRPVITTLTLIKQLRTTETNKRFYAKIKKVNDTLSSGKILIEAPINISKNLELEIGDVLMCKIRLKSFNLPMSPYNFNYKAYLAKQHIYAKIKLNKSYRKIGECNLWFIELQKIRNSVTNLLEQSTLSNTTVGLIKAMLLGDKEGITDEMQSSFTNSGVVHIIAISGMHVGVLYFMLLLSFGFVKRIKYGDYLYVIIVLLCLWIFAVFSGLSSSVIRSVTMFSFFTLTKLKKGERLLLEAIITSMLVLLLIDTDYIYNVGFQLSYTAVISIIVFYPLISKWVKGKNKITQYFIDVLVVSVIAQMGVLAFSLYYFHQIPLQFLVANFFAVSLLPFVLYGGILVLIKLVITTNHSFVEIIYDEFITFYLHSIRCFSSFSNWIIKDINIKETEVLYYYVFLFCIWYVVNSFSFKRLREAVCLVVICQLIILMEFTFKTKTEELIIYNNYVSSIITYRRDKELIVLGKDSLTEKDTFLLKSNQLKNNIKKIVCCKNDVFTFKENTYLLVNKNKQYNLLSQKGLILIMSNNPKINFERLLISLKPKQVIIESSNYSNNQVKWKSTCKKLQVPFYNIADLGAYRKN